MLRTMPFVKSFNPSIGLTSVPTTNDPDRVWCPSLFQSLNRAYKRSDTCAVNDELKASLDVSIPQSGLQAFRPGMLVLAMAVAGFQSLNRAYKRSDREYCRCGTCCLLGFNPSIGLTSVPTDRVTVPGSKSRRSFN